MAFVVRRCRERSTAALQERTEAWEKRRVSVSLAGQSAQLPDIKGVRPEYREIHSQVLPDVLTRLDRAFQAFFRRVKNGENPGYPRLKGANRYDSFTYKQFGTGATLDNGFLVLSKMGRIALRWSRPAHGGDPQNRHHLARGAWLVRVLLLCRRAKTAACTHRARDGHRPRD